jgi:hypothetical protein
VYVTNYLLSWQYPYSQNVKKFLPAAYSMGQWFNLYDYERQAEIYYSSSAVSGDYKNYLRKKIIKTGLAKDYRCANDYQFYVNDYLFYKKSLDDVTDEYLLKNGFKNKQEYYNYVVHWQIIDDCLKMAYNSDGIQNKLKLDFAREILAKTSSVEDFQIAVNQYSEDLQSIKLQGDLGFLSKADIIPELWDAIIQARPGEIYQEVVTSRYGYHILYLVEIGTKDEQKFYRVKQIQINTNGFSDWMDAQLNNHKVIFFK